MKWNAKQYEEAAAFVPEFGKELIDMLKPKASDRLLDVGCGDGALTQSLELHCAEIIGIDADENMVARAIQRGLKAFAYPASDLPFDNEFDGALTNAVLHWIPNKAKVLKAVHKALKPNKRFVGEFGGQGCIETIVEGFKEVCRGKGIDSEVKLPWHFSNKDDFHSLLEQMNFEVKRCETFPRRPRLPQGLRGWLDTFLTPNLGLPANLIDELYSELEKKVRSELYHNGHWYADYVRIRFNAESKK